MKARFSYCLIICLISLSCSNDFSSEYGIVTVQLQNGQKVYFKREVWGLNGDQFCGFFLANKGYDTRLIQDYLGHRNINHTVQYTRVAAKRFEGLWRK